MKKYIKIISIYIGIDFLGFPKFIEHYKPEGIIFGINISNHIQKNK